MENTTTTTNTTTEMASEQFEANRQFTKRLSRQATWTNSLAELFGRWSWLTKPVVGLPRSRITAEELLERGALSADIGEKACRVIANVDALNNAFASGANFETMHALVADLLINLKAVRSWFVGADYTTRQVRQFNADPKSAENLTAELLALAARIYTTTLVLFQSWSYDEFSREHGRVATVMDLTSQGAISRNPLACVTERRALSERSKMITHEEANERSVRAGRKPIYKHASLHIRHVPTTYLASEAGRAMLLADPSDRTSFSFSRTEYYDFRPYHPLANTGKLEERTNNCAKSHVAFFSQLVEDNAGNRFEAGWVEALAKAEIGLRVAVARSAARTEAIKADQLSQLLPVATSGVTVQLAFSTWNTAWKGQRARRMPSSSYRGATEAISTINRTVSLITRKGEASAAQVEKVEAALRELVLAYPKPNFNQGINAERHATVQAFAQAAVDVLTAVAA